MRTSVANQSSKTTESLPAIGVYICQCGLNIGKTVDCKGVAEKVASLPGVVLARDITYACSEPGQMEILADIEAHGLNRVVVASCSPRLHEATFRNMMKQAGLNPYLMEMANIREQCAWVHMDQPQAATAKALDLVTMAINKARLLMPLTEEVVPVEKKTLVIGGGIAGIQAALDLADNDYQVTLVERTGSIGGMMARLDKTFPTMDCSI